MGPWDPHEQTDTHTTESITLLQLRWWVVIKMLHSNVTYYYNFRNICIEPIKLLIFRATSEGFFDKYEELVKHSSE